MTAKEVAKAWEDITGIAPDLPIEKYIKYLGNKFPGWGFNFYSSTTDDNAYLFCRDHNTGNLVHIFIYTGDDPTYFLLNDPTGIPGSSL